VEEGYGFTGALLYGIGDTPQAAEETAEGRLGSCMPKIKREVGFAARWG